MTLTILQGGIVMSSQIKHAQLYNIHPLAHMQGPCILTSAALFTIGPNHIMWCHNQRQ